MAAPKASLFPIYQLMDAFEAHCHGTPGVKPQHRSMYYYLLGFARKLGGALRFTLAHETGMHGTGIGSWATYNTALQDLDSWGFIAYTPGANRFKAPVVELQNRCPTDDVLVMYWQSYCRSIDTSTGDMNRHRDVGTDGRKDQVVSTLKEELAKEAANAATLLEENEKLKGRLLKAEEVYKADQSKITALEAEVERLKIAPPVAPPPRRRAAAKKNAQPAESCKVTIEAYRVWYEKRTNEKPPLMGRDYGALKAIHDYFRSTLPEDAAEADIGQAFTDLLGVWPLLDPFAQKRVAPHEIQNDLTKLIALRAAPPQQPAPNGYHNPHNNRFNNRQPAGNGVQLASAMATLDPADFLGRR